MIAATLPVQRASHAQLLVVDSTGELRHAERSQLGNTLRSGDLLVANDAATIPASLVGRHEPSGQVIEIRLAGRGSLASNDVKQFTAVAFGAGDHRTPTELRPPPPALRPGDYLVLGPLRAAVLKTLGHPRLLAVAFVGTQQEIWAGIADHGRPIQYAHVEQRLALWDVWTRVASLPAAFEPPSAGFVLDWELLASLRERSIDFATLTHAAGISSTGDPALDRRFPLNEAYRIPQTTVQAIARTQARGGRVIALGTTVARALEHAASGGELSAGDGVATQRIGPATHLRVIDAIFSGVHEPGDSHYELLRAFADDSVLRRMSATLEEHGYRSHEFGDSVLVERRVRQPAADAFANRAALGSEPCPSAPELKTVN